MSLRRALQLRLLVPVALLMALSSVFAYVMTLHYANSIYDSWLYDMAHSVTLEVGEDGPESVHTDEIEQQLKTWMTGDQDSYSIAIKGRVIAGEKDLPGPLTSVDQYSTDAYLYNVSWKGREVRIMNLHAPATDEHAALEVRIASDNALRYDLAKEVFFTIAIPGLLLILTTALLMRHVISNSLKGLGSLTTRLVSHREGETLKLDPSKLPSELREMTQAFAGVVERNNSLLTAQRQFIANAAHQLRSPMAATELHLDGVEHAESESLRKQSLAQLRRSVERTNRLAQQLLSLARLEPGTHLPVKLQRVDLADTLRAAGTDYVPLALNKGIDIELDVPESPVWITGHSLLLREAFSNLIDNAVRYHPGGGNIRLGIETSGGRVSAHVSDDGRGISAEFASRLFTRFARSDESGSGGAGLGLSIVREIVDLHHGRVVAEPGEGGRGLKISMELLPWAEQVAPSVQRTRSVSGPVSEPSGEPLHPRGSPASGAA